MNALNFIQTKIGYSILTRLLKKKRRSKKFHNFSSAKSIGVIFNASTSDSYQCSKDFIEQLKLGNVKVEGLGYTKKRKVNGLASTAAQDGLKVFSIRDRNWYQKPTNNAVSEFTQNQYDMLIDLSLEQEFSVKYIMGTTDAEFKVGHELESNELIYDFVLDMKERNELPFYIDQIKHYLKNIRNGQ